MEGCDIDNEEEWGDGASLRDAHFHLFEEFWAAFEQQAACTVREER
jgi:hypothetical protein